MRLAEQEEKKGVGSPGLTCCAQFFLSSSCCWRILAISFWCCSASSDAQSWTVVAIGEEAKKSHRAEMGSGPRRKGGRGYEVGTLVSTQERFHLGTNLQRQPSDLSGFADPPSRQEQVVSSCPPSIYSRAGTSQDRCSPEDVLFALPKI